MERVIGIGGGMERRLAHIGRLLVAVIAISGCQSSASRGPVEGTVVARVNGVAITSSEVDEMTRIAAWMDADSLAPRHPGRASTAVLDRLVDGVLVSEAAAGRSISVTDAESAAALNRFAAFSGRSAAELGPESAAARVLRRELVSRRYWKETVTDLIRVSDLDIAHYVADHPGEVPVPAGPDTYDLLRPLIEPILARQHEEAAVAARLERLRRHADIVSRASS